MSREIKFRTYREGKMQTTSDGWNGDIFIRLDGTPYVCHDSGEFDEGMTVGFSTHDDIKVMQYTGLKDMNGKEIYEGDIISYSMFAKQYRVEVGFSDGMFTADKGINTKQLSWIGFDDVFVAGNIYENPELLSD